MVSRGAQSQGSWRCSVSSSQVLLIAVILLGVAAGHAEDPADPNTKPTRYVDASRTTFPSRSSRETVAIGQLRVSKKAQEQLRKVRADLKQGHIVEADKRVERILSKSPDFADALSVRARIRLKENRIPEAFSDARSALARDPQLANAHFTLGEILNHEHRYAEALPSLERCIALAPQSWTCRYERARALVATVQLRTALEEVEQAAALGGLAEEPAAIYYLRGFVRILLGDSSTGSKDLESCLQFYPTGTLAEGVRRKLRAIQNAQTKTEAVSAAPLKGIATEMDSGAVPEPF